MARPAFTFVRVAALIVRDGAILLTPPWVTERGSQQLWEAPGGALEPGESLEEAVKREAREEIGAEIEPGGLAFVVQAPVSESERAKRPDLNLMSLEICLFARLLSADSELRSEHPFIPPPVWVPLEDVADLPTLPFSLRGWTRWVVETGRPLAGVPLVMEHGGADAAAHYALFLEFADKGF